MYTIELPPCLERLNPENRAFVIRHISKFTVLACEKYVKGQEEHGGELQDRNCLLEAQLENIDMMWYLSAEVERQRNNIK